MTVFQIVNSRVCLRSWCEIKDFYRYRTFSKYLNYAQGSALRRLVKNRFKNFRIFWPSLLVSGKFPGQKIKYLPEARTEYNSYDFSMSLRK